MAREEGLPLLCGGAVVRGNMRRPCGEGNVLYLNCINVDTVIVILDYSFIRRYPWENCVKGVPGRSVLLLKTAHGTNYLKIKV